MQGPARSCSRCKEDPTDRRTKRRCSKIYQRLRPGNPPQLEKAKRAVQREVPRPQPLPPGQGRPLPHQPQVQPGRPRRRDDPASRRLRQRDPLHAEAARQRARVHIDDIDHLGNRRLRTIDELAADELRKGFLKLRRTVQERMSHPRPAGHDAAVADQPQEHLGGDRVLLRPRRAVAGRRPDQPAGAAHARAAAVGPRARAA